MDPNDPAKAAKEETKTFTGFFLDAFGSLGTAIKERLDNRFVSATVISFALCNWDILLKLAYGSGVLDYRIEAFKLELNSSYDFTLMSGKAIGIGRYRIYFPIVFSVFWLFGLSLVFLYLESLYDSIVGTAKSSWESVRDARIISRTKTRQDLEGQLKRTIQEIQSTIDKVNRTKEEFDAAIREKTNSILDVMAKIEGGYGWVEEFKKASINQRQVHVVGVLHYHNIRMLIKSPAIDGVIVSNDQMRSSQRISVSNYNYLYYYMAQLGGALEIYSTDLEVYNKPAKLANKILEELGRGASIKNDEYIFGPDRAELICSFITEFISCIGDLSSHVESALGAYDLSKMDGIENDK